MQILKEIVLYDPNKAYISNPQKTQYHHQFNKGKDDVFFFFSILKIYSQEAMDGLKRKERYRKWVSQKIGWREIRSGRRRRRRDEMKSHLNRWSWWKPWRESSFFLPSSKREEELLSSVPCPGGVLQSMVHDWEWDLFFFLMIVNWMGPNPIRNG